ncbi:hypothetical protein [uncultured Roseobacter sp.]|uniref:hypothetical protein n=1 Tax=uncultured Roseobacter sp. TaxID=114847 RepID=UPI00261A97DA|nr:hypothetical protein [uncultured Roseobacter sp.]
MRLAAFVILCLAGCTRFPEIDAATDDVARDAPYVELVPLNRITDQAAPQSQESAETQETLEARAARLRARAARLKQAGLSDAERNRLQETIQ